MLSLLCPEFLSLLGISTHLEDKVAGNGHVKLSVPPCREFLLKAQSNLNLRISYPLLWIASLLPASRFHGGAVEVLPSPHWFQRQTDLKQDSAFCLGQRKSTRLSTHQNKFVSTKPNKVLQVWSQVSFWSETKRISSELSPEQGVGKRARTSIREERTINIVMWRDCSRPP